MKRKGKGKTKGVGAEKKLKKPAAGNVEPEVTIQPPVEQEPPLPPPMVHNVDESDQGEKAGPQKKRSRTETSFAKAEGSSSRPEAWDPALLLSLDSIFVRDSILDDSNAEVSAQVAHGLAFAACLPRDMKQWAGTQSGPVFCHITWGLMMVMFLS